MRVTRSKAIPGWRSKASRWVSSRSLPSAIRSRISGENALPAALLIASFVGTGSSFLAFSSLAERRGLKADNYPAKGIYYLGGLTEGAETITAFAAMCLWPAAFPSIALVFAALCTLTTLSRWYQGWVTFADT